MRCPFCNADDTKVVDSRLVTDGCQVRRRRQCLACLERFTTYESIELLMPAVIKRDGTRVPFSEQKLRLGVQRSLEKRPVSVDELEGLINTVIKTIRSCGDREVASAKIGECVMQCLRQLDEVAYVRFASVYKRFADVQEFSETISHLKDRSGSLKQNCADN